MIAYLAVSAIFEKERGQEQRDQVPILLSEVEQEQRPSGNGDREAIVVGAPSCDSEGDRAYTRYAPHFSF